MNFTFFARCCQAASVGGLACMLSAAAATPSVRVVEPQSTRILVASASQPAEFRYTAFPSILQLSPDEIWVAYKVGRSHATDAGAAMEVIRHTLSTGTSRLLQRMVAPVPKLYQMGELVRFPDGAIGLYIDVQSVGWDGRHYRSGAETFRWDPTRGQFEGPRPLAPIDGLLYGYPFDFVSEGRTTWQLIMAFGYHQPGGRWSVDAVRSDDSGKSWRFVRDLSGEFGGLKANESALVRHGEGFIVTTRGYDRIERLHRTDGEFRVQHQVVLTGNYPFINSHIGRPRLFVRDGHGYLIGRNVTQPAGTKVNPMQLCLFRFDLETLAITSCVVLDNAEKRNVTDGYYAVVAFSGERDDTRLHVITYKGIDRKPPDIVRLDYRWADVK